jgi:hypothetical protein
MEGFSPGEPGRAGSGLAAGRRDPPEEGELVGASRTAGFFFLLHVLDGGEVNFWPGSHLSFTCRVVFRKQLHEQGREPCFCSFTMCLTL